MAPYLAFYFGLFLLLASRAYAYLDPGTGSLLLYAIVGIGHTFEIGAQEIMSELIQT